MSYNCINQLMKHLKPYNESTTASLKLSPHASLIDYMDDVFLDISDKGGVVNSYYKYSNHYEFYTCELNGRNSITWGDLRDILLTLVSYFDEIMIKRYSLRINGDGYRSIEEFDEYLRDHINNNMPYPKDESNFKIRDSAITFWIKSRN